MQTQFSQLKQGRFKGRGRVSVDKGNLSQRGATSPHRLFETSHPICAFWQAFGSSCIVKFGEKTSRLPLPSYRTTYHLDYSLSPVEREILDITVQPQHLVTSVLLKHRIYTLHAYMHMIHSMHHIERL